MNVAFYFPGKQFGEGWYSVQLDHVPRLDETIAGYSFVESNFLSPEVMDYFKENGYWDKTWRVIDVTWYIETTACVAIHLAEKVVKKKPNKNR